MELDLGDIVVRGVRLDLAEQRGEALLVRLFGRHLVAQGVDDAVHLRLDLGADLGDLGPHVDDLRIAVAVLGGKIGGASLRVGLLRPQVLDHRRLQHFEDVVVPDRGVGVATPSRDARTLQRGEL